MSSPQSSLIQPGFAARRKACPKGLEVDCGATGNDGFHACCPSSFTCPGPQFNVVCCPPGAQDCSEDALAKVEQPRCANGTWDMFDNGGLFCCEHGLPGYNKSNTNGCATPNVKLPAEVILLQTKSVGIDPATMALSSSIPPASSTLASTPSSRASQSSSSSTPVGAIAGGVVGGIAGLALIIFLAWFCLRRRRRQQRTELDGQPHMVQHGGPHAQKYAMDARDHEIHEVGETGARAPDAELAAPQRPVELDGTSRTR